MPSHKTSSVSPFFCMSPFQQKRVRTKSRSGPGRARPRPRPDGDGGHRAPMQQPAGAGTAAPPSRVRGSAVEGREVLVTRGEHRGLSGEFFFSSAAGGKEEKSSRPDEGYAPTPEAPEDRACFLSLTHTHILSLSRGLLLPGKIEAAIPGGWYLVSDLFRHDATNAVISSRDLELVPARVTSLKQTPSSAETREGVR